MSIDKGVDATCKQTTRVKSTSTLFNQIKDRSPITQPSIIVDLNSPDGLSKRISRLITSEDKSRKLLKLNSLPLA